MSVHLITGYAGKEHITSADQGSFNAAVMGGGEFVMERGEQFRCQVISNNQVRIYDGDALMQGRHIIIDRNTYVETTHDNGTQGYKRIDLIVLTYEKNAVTNVETVKLEVIKGTPSESNPAVPVHTTGDILNSGEAKNQMPLYKIPFDGLSIGEPVKLFSTVPTLETTKKEVDKKVSDKITELDESFSELEGSIDDKIAEAGKPLVSNIEDMKMLESYGEYSADAKTVGEIARSFQDGCNTIVSGVTAQGVTPTSNSPADIVTAVNTVATNKYNAGVTATKVGNVAPGQVLNGKTFTSASGVGLTGTMPNKGAVTGSISSSGGTYTIPAGYHNGSGKVTGPTLEALVGTNVTLENAANLLTGHTAYGKNGTKYTGSMANKGSWTNTPTSKGKVTVPAGYHNGSGYVDTTSVYNSGVTNGSFSVDKFLTSGTRSTGASPASGSYTETYTVPSSANGILIIFPVYENGASGTVSDITVNTTKGTVSSIKKTANNTMAVSVVTVKNCSGATITITHTMTNYKDRNWQIYSI